MTTTKTRKIKLNIPRPANLKLAQQELVLKVLAANRWARHLAADELGISIRHMADLISEFKAEGINIPYNQTRAEPGTLKKVKRNPRIRKVYAQPQGKLEKHEPAHHQEPEYSPLDG